MLCNTAKPPLPESCGKTKAPFRELLNRALKQGASTTFFITAGQDSACRPKGSMLRSKMPFICAIRMP